MEIYNSTILETGFYLELKAQKKKLFYNDIESIYRFIYNRVIDELVGLDILDNYRRLRVDPSQINQILKRAYCQLETDIDDPIEETLYEAFIVKDVLSMPEYVKVYPASVCGLALLDLGKSLGQGFNGFTQNYQKKSSVDSNIRLDMKWLQRDAISTNVYYTANDYSVSTAFHNQFGNEVVLTIVSNTVRMNNVFAELDSKLDTVADLQFVIGKAPNLIPEHKLLCATIIYSNEKEVE